MRFPFTEDIGSLTPVHYGNRKPATNLAEYEINMKAPLSIAPQGRKCAGRGMKRRQMRESEYMTAPIAARHADRSSLPPLTVLFHPTANKLSRALYK
jgi:hypothetical protein